MNIARKIKTVEALLNIRQQIVSQGKTIVFTNGCFDIIHRGHVEYLLKARQYGDVLVIGLNSDSSVTRLKGPGRPIMPQDDRALLLASLEMVDYVVIFEESTPLRLVELIRPHILVKGGDYPLNNIVGREIVENSGGKVLTVPLVEGRSTTSIIQKIVMLTKQGLLK